MNRFNVQGQVHQDGEGEFVKFSEIEEMCNQANSFLETLLVQASNEEFSNEKVLETMRGFFRFSLAS